MIKRDKKCKILIRSSNVKEGGKIGDYLSCETHSIQFNYWIVHHNQCGLIEGTMSSLLRDEQALTHKLLQKVFCDQNGPTSFHSLILRQ